jgi:PKD repeat protein
MLHRFLRYIFLASVLVTTALSIQAQPCADTQPTIAGPQVVSNNQVGVIYSTPSIPGHTYSWTVTGGSITAGTGTSQITVAWGAIGTGSVSVTETNPAASCSTTVNKGVTIQPLLISYFYYTNTSCYGDVVSFWDASVADPANPIVSWNWNFGDATTSTLQNPTHMYLPPFMTTWTVTLIVTNTTGQKDTIYDAVYVNPNQFIPTAKVSSAIPNCTYQPVAFNSAASTTPPGTGTIIHWDWSFGDPASGSANLSNLQNPNHVFTAPGVYTINLEITNERYCKNDTSFQVTILPSVPTSQFDYSTPNCLGYPIDFTDQSTFPAGHDLVSWTWDFGDLSAPITINAPANPNLTHYFPGLGPYPVKLVVTNDLGCKDSLYRNVKLDPSPLSEFSYVMKCLGDTVPFTDLSLVNGGPIITSWSWNFGDPASPYNLSTQQHPKHVFTNIGDYIVTLVTTNSSGCPDSIQKQITVFPKPPVEFTWEVGTQNNEIQFHLDTNITPVGMIGNMVLWNFGDGTFGYGYDPAHIYPAAGTFDVTVTVTDTIGCSNDITHVIGAPSVPVAFFASTSPVCHGQEMCFTDLSSVPTPPFGWITTWIWSWGDGTPNDTVHFPNDPNLCHTYATVDTFAVTLTIYDNNGYTDDYTANVIILPIPIANYIYSTACQDQMIQFTDLSTPNGGGNIISWDWNFADPGSGINNNSGLQHPTHIFSHGDSTYLVRLVVLNFNNCTDTIIKPVYVFPAPPVDFTHDTACLNQLVNFYTDTVITHLDSIVIWSWDFGDGTPLVTDPVNTAHLYTSPGTYTVTLTVQDYHGCRNTVSHTVRVNPLPVPNFVWATPVCQGAVVQFTDQSLVPAGYTGYIARWHWEFGDGTDTNIYLPNSPNIPHVYTGPGVSYTVRLTVWTNDSCQQFIEKTLNLIPAPIANFDFASTRCKGQSVSFNDLSQPNGGGNVVQWQWIFGDPGSGANNFATIQHPSHTYANQGTYDVKLIVTNGNNCNDTIIKQVVINPLPVANFSADTACIGTATVFTDLSTTTALNIISYSWTFGDGTPPSTLPNPTHIYANFGVFNVTLTVVDANGCIKDTTRQVLVQPLPIAAFSFTTPNCLGAPVQYTDMSSTVPGFLAQIQTWQWDFGDGTITPPINWPATPNISHTFAGTATSHTVRLTVTTADGCTHFVEHVVTSIPQPIANFSYPATNCATQSVPFSDLSQPNGGGTIITWNWNFGDPASGINNTSTSQHPVHQFSGPNATGFSVTLIVTNASGCHDTIVKSVIVSPRPLANFSTDTVCLGSLTTFTDLSSTTSGTIASHYWEFGDGQTSTANNPTHLYGNAGTFNVTLTVTTSEGCTKDTVKQVNVWGKPVASFSYSSPNCAGDSVMFTDLSSTPHGSIQTWVWDFGDGSPVVTVNFPASPDVNHLFTNGGTYNVTLTITTSDGCENVKILPVVIGYAPLANFSFAANGCALQAVQFNDLSQLNGGPAITTWAWDFGDPASGTNNNSTTQNPSHAFSAGGPFDVVLIVTNANGCIDSISKPITINDAPVAEFTADTACTASETLFTDASSTSSGTIVAWLWNFNDPSSGSNNTSTLQNPVHVYNTPGTYFVTLEVTNSNQCVNDTVVEITVNPKPTAMFEYSASCVSAPTQFTDLSIATGSQISSWSWDFGDGTGTSIEQNPTYTYTASGNYLVTLVVTNLSNCSDTVEIEVVSRPTPTSAFTYLGFFCPPGEVNFQDESTGSGSAIAERLWIFEPGYTSTLPNPTYTFGNTDTTYAVTLIVTDTYGCQDTLVDSVYVKPGFEFTFTYDSVCLGYPTHFTTINLTEGDTIYSPAWDFGDPNSAPNNVAYVLNPTHVFTEPGLYNVKLRVFNSDNCVDSIYKVIQVYPPPVADFAFLSEPCDSTIHFTAIQQTSGLPPVTSWEWRFGDGTPPLIIPAPGPGDTSHLYVNPGIYQVQMIITNGSGCIDSITQSVQRFPCIKASYAYQDTLRCANYEVAFSDSSLPVSRITQWQWTWDDGTDTTYTQHASPITHTFGSAGTYNVKLTINAVVNGTTILDSTIRQVIIHPTPETYFANDAVCLNMPTLFRDTSNTFGEPVSVWSWNFGEPSSGGANISTIRNPGHTYATRDTFDVKLIVMNKYGCKDSLTKSTRIYGLPEAHFDNTVACTGDPTYFTDISLISDTTIAAWHWSFGDPESFRDTSNLEEPSYRYKGEGTYDVRLIVQDYYGCRDTVDSTVMVHITPVSTFNITNNFGGTQGKIKLNNLSTGATAYYWDFGNGKTSEDENPVLTYTEDGTYTIKLISLNEFDCADTTFYEYELLFKGLYVPNAFSPSSSNLSVRLFKPIGMNLKQYHVMVFDTWGHMLWESTKLDTEGRPEEGWDGTYNGNLMPQGNYMWKINALFIDNAPWEGSDIGQGEYKTIGTVTLIQ